MAWNRPNNDGAPSGDLQRTRHQAQRTKHALLVVLAILAIGGGLAVYFVCGRQGDDTAGGGTPALPKRGKIAEVAPSIPVRKAVGPKEEPKGRPGWTNLQGKVVSDPRFVVPPGSYRDERGVLRRPGGMRILEREPAHVINISKSKTPRMFENGAENQILDLLTFDGTKTRLAAGIYGPGFVNSFVKSLEHEIKILPEDDEATREKKQAVIDAKKELKEAMGRGEDICQIMRESSLQMQQMAKYRQDMEREVVRAFKETTERGDALSDDDIADYVTAANKMLEERGAEPLKAPKLIMIGQRLQEKQNEQQEMQ